MARGRSNKSNKKNADNDQQGDGSPDLPVKGAPGTDKAAQGASSADASGPFEDLLDLQNNNDRGAESDENPGEEGKDADESVAKPPADNDEVAGGEAGDGEANEDADAVSTMAPDDEDDGYLSDDSDEHLEPDAISSVIALKRFSLTLLVPFPRKAEVNRASVTIAALLDDWKEHLSPDAQQTTTYQELPVTYFSSRRFGRLQVTFNHVKDANYVWNHVINHECLNGECIDLTWQHPENSRFLLTGMDTDRIRGLIIPHVADEYRWRYFVEDPSTGKRDPAVVLTSTGGSQEEWVCVQTACEKAQGNRFEQAAAHIASARHKGGLRKEGSATRVNTHSQKLLAFKKEYIVKSAKQ
ncbi:unnamed protein product [Closterium sp. Naga37s-1]|nr:unnamed protein product [Closterium sp. Naga37s-1]